MTTSIVLALGILGTFCSVLLHYVRELSRDEVLSAHALTKTRLSHALTLLSVAIALIAVELPFVPIVSIYYGMTVSTTNLAVPEIIAALFVFFPAFVIALGTTAFVRHSGLIKGLPEALSFLREFSVIRCVELSCFVAEHKAIYDIRNSSTAVFGPILRRATEALQRSAPSTIGMALLPEAGEFIEQLGVRGDDEARKIISDLVTKGSLIRNNLADVVYLTTPEQIRRLQERTGRYPVFKNDNALCATVERVSATTLFEFLVRTNEPIELTNKQLVDEVIRREWTDEIKKCVGTSSDFRPQLPENIQDFVEIDGRLELVKRGDVDHFLLAPSTYVAAQVSAGRFVKPRKWMGLRSGKVSFKE